MPTVIVTGLPVSVEFKAQYVSAALNAKQVAAPRGIVRGGYLVPDAAPDTVLLAVDPMTGDMVVNAYGISSLTGADPYAVTYRMDADYAISIAADNALHFIYFEGGYAPLTITAAQLVDYTEAEFEAGTADAAGGVLLGVVKANASAGFNISYSQIMTAGMSNTLYVPFRRHMAADFVGAQGYQPVRERVLSQLNFGYTRALECNFTQLTVFTDISASFEYLAVDTPVGNGALHYEPAGNAGSAAYAANMRSDGFMIPNSTTLPRKVRVEMVYRTDGGYVANAASNFSMLGIRYDDVVTTITTPAYAPVADWPTADTSGQWALWVQEWDIPQDSSLGFTLAALKIFPYFYLQSGWIEIASITCIGFEEVGSPAELVRADGLAAVPVSYGTVATSVDDLRSSAQRTTEGLRIRAPFSSTSDWTIRQYASQRIPSGSTSTNTLYIAPNTNDVASRLHIGAAAVTDLATSVAENRYAGVTIYGDGVGTTTYTTELAGSPLRVDDIRPYAGVSSTAHRIDVRTTTGSKTAYPAPFISSASTAAATGILSYNSSTGVWASVGATNQNVNFASVSTSANTVTITFAAAFVDLYYIPLAMYRSAAAGSRDYFVQISGQTTGDFDIKIREAGTATPVSENNDRIWFACFGRLV
jgi:hypothetical protein